MKITSERLPKSLIAMDIEPDKALVEREMNKAAKRVAQKVNIPGFRPGKAPRFMIENYYGADIIREEATDNIINSAFQAALEQEGVNPVAQASLESVKHDPFVFRILVPVEPTVTLGDYRSVREELKEDEITDEMLESAMEQTREDHVVLQELEEQRPAQTGDQLDVTMDSFLDGERLSDLQAAAAGDDDDDDEDDDEEDDDDDALFENEVDDEDETAEEDDEESDEEDEQGEEAKLILEKSRLVPELYEGLIGAEVGQTYEIEATMPEDHSNELIAGKTIMFKVTVNNIQERIVPEWEELPTLEEYEGDIEALRTETRERLTTNMRENYRRDLLNRYIGRVVADTEYDVPDAMVRERAHEMLHEQAEQFKRYGISLEQFLQFSNKTHDDAVVELMEPAFESLKSTLALREIFGRENLTLEEGEFPTEVDSLLEGYPEEQREDVRGRLESDLRPAVESSILDRKLRDRLVEIATGNAPALTESSDDVASDSVEA